MKKIVAYTSAAALLVMTSGVASSYAAETFPKTYQTDGTITFTPGDGETKPVDPENPDPTKPVEPVDPNQPGTGGSLSIDYGSRFNFQSQKISTQDQVYYAAPDRIKDPKDPSKIIEKPTYVQITDKRGTLAGWKLSLKQLDQFKTADGTSLDGAQLTFSNAEAASIVDGKYKPSNVLAKVDLVPGAQDKPVITAEKGTGVGTWVYRFGANTEANKKAVQLSVPGTTVKLAQKYTTSLVWSLEDTPGNE